LARHSTGMDEANGFLDAAEVELRRVSAIVSQTLKFHKQASSPQEVYLGELMASVLSIYQGRIVNSKARIEQRDRTTRPVRCFEGEVRQVLSNLIGNALDAMPNGGRLILRGREGRNWRTGEAGVVITVADTGTG